VTRFLDGPAAGVQLMLNRAPVFLRVCVKAGEGANLIDALDMLEDTPAEGETLYAYRRVGSVTTVHLDYTDKKTKKRMGKWFKAAEYRLVPTQPSAATMADSDLWKQWCLDNWEGRKK
jgi:hypothetical protein